MKANFDACMAEVFKHEGGYVNDRMTRAVKPTWAFRSGPIRKRTFAA